jgi:hypothetical protein
VITPSQRKRHRVGLFTGLGGLGFDLGQSDRWADAFFRADSVMTLAQAGNYVGPKDIEEYVRRGCSHLL